MAYDEIRVAFEVWAKDWHSASVMPGWQARHTPSGVYLNWEIASAWSGWRAGWLAANSVSAVYLRDLSAEERAELLNVLARESNQIAPGIALDSAILDEREACARVCEEIYGLDADVDEPWVSATRECAEAIRMRSNA